MVSYFLGLAVILEFTPQVNRSGILVASLALLVTSAIIERIQLGVHNARVRKRIAELRRLPSQIKAKATISDESSSLNQPLQNLLTSLLRYLHLLSPLPQDIATPSFDVTPTVEHDYLVVHAGPKSTWAHLKKMGATTYG